MTTELPIWTIYERPRDFPSGFVVRRSRARPDGTLEADQVAQFAPDLARARALVPPGLYRLPRQPGDDPVIVELWL